MASPTQYWAVITGGSTGIGAAIFRRLVQHGEPNLHCLAVGRRLPQLEEAKRLAITSTSSASSTSTCTDDEKSSNEIVDAVNSSRAHIVSADVSTPEGISTIVSALPPNACVKYLIHNAGTLGPIGPLTDIDRSTFEQVVATNLNAPLFLTQALLPHLKRCAANNNNNSNSKNNAPRVLHVSSGAAHSSYVGWAPYCTTKAGLHMMYRCLSSELSPYNIHVGSVRPGVVDTPMQSTIRDYNGPTDDFPMQQKFFDLHSSNKLEHPDTVAKFVHWLLSEVDEEEFIREEFDIRNCKEDERWLKYDDSTS